MEASVNIERIFVLSVFGNGGIIQSQVPDTDPPQPQVEK
jgi:hypothetical protein